MLFNLEERFPDERARSIVDGRCHRPLTSEFFDFFQHVVDRFLVRDIRRYANGLASRLIDFGGQGFIAGGCTGEESNRVLLGEPAGNGSTSLCSNALVLG